MDVDLDAQVLVLDVQIRVDQIVQDLVVLAVIIAVEVVAQKHAMVHVQLHVKLPVIPCVQAVRAAAQLHAHHVQVDVTVIAQADVIQTV